MSQTCANCEFSSLIGERFGDEGWYRCRRYPPVVSSDPNLNRVFKNSGVQGTWPVVWSNDVCGEWSSPQFLRIPIQR